MIYLSQLTNIDTFLLTEVHTLFMLSPKSFHLMSFSCPRIPSKIPHYAYLSWSLGSFWLWEFLRLCLLLMTLMVLRSFVLLRPFVGFSSIGIFWCCSHDYAEVMDFGEEAHKVSFLSHRIKSTSYNMIFHCSHWHTPPYWDSVCQVS